MQKVHTAEALFIIHMLRDHLQTLGIQTIIRNEYAMGAAGDLAPIDCWPELWVADDCQVARAKQSVTDLLEQVEKATQARSEWRCTYCGESNGPAFDSCWQCGAAPE